MIKNDIIKLKTKGCRKLLYFKSIGYDTSGEYFEIKIKDLNIGSREIVEIICDFCGNEVENTYKSYISNISNTGKYACSKKCGSIKSIETNLKNNGVEYPMQSREVREKSKRTNLKNNGVEYPMQSEEIKNKSKSSMIEKYGVDHISKTEHFKKKFKETCFENLGVEFPMQSEIIREKSKKTLLENYGVDNPSKSPEIRLTIESNNYKKYGFNYPSKLESVKEKTKINNVKKYGVSNPSKLDFIKSKILQTNIDRYGVEYPLQNDEIKEKSKHTNINKYGVDNPIKLPIIQEKVKQTNLNRFGVEWAMQSDEVKTKSKSSILLKYNSENINKSDIYRSKFFICQNINYIKYLNNSISLFKCDSDKPHNFEMHTDNFYRRIESNLPLCTICYPISDQKSIKEKELLRFIKTIYSKEVIENYRDGLEIDIYLPDLKLGFEFNGLYWHSEEWKDRCYHLSKTQYFSDRGIRIIHIWEDDWIFKENIVKSQINNWIGLTKNRIFARNCEVREVSSNVSSDFLEKNHIQGKDKSIVKLGLYLNSELVSLMTFNNFEGRKKMEEDGWNLSRFCNKINSNNVGGASRLLKYFVKIYKPKRIISYTDRDWSIGGLYINIGFTMIKETKPDYKYIIKNRRVNKSRFRKSNLKTQLSESEEMKHRNINKIWDCGKIKFEIKLFCL